MLIDFDIIFTALPSNLSVETVYTIQQFTSQIQHFPTSQAPKSQSSISVKFSIYMQIELEVENAFFCLN
jgi:hypothetical protein